MRRLALALVASLGLCGCRAHPQQEGSYRLTLGEVTRDDCNLAQKPELVADLKLVIAGAEVYASYSLFGLQLEGAYVESSLVAPDERFVMDGSVENVATQVSGRDCTLDLVTAHVDATTQTPVGFGGSLSVRLDTRVPEACKCDLQATFKAVRVGP